MQGPVVWISNERPEWDSGLLLNFPETVQARFRIGYNNIDPQRLDDIRDGVLVRVPVHRRIQNAESQAGEVSTGTFR